jgi:hypothetical protein
MWGDTGRYMLVPVNTTTCKHTHTHTSDQSCTSRDWSDAALVDWVQLISDTFTLLFYSTEGCPGVFERSCEHFAKLDSKRSQHASTYTGYTQGSQYIMHNTLEMVTCQLDEGS